MKKDEGCMACLDCHQRWHGVYAEAGTPTGIRFIAPDCRENRRPVFRHQPVEFNYDEHGYETITPDGAPVWAARFTPDQTGLWRYVWLDGERVLDDGEFTCSAARFIRPPQVRDWTPIGLRCVVDAPGQEK
jgi:hypothetical protein